ncbi:MAG: glycosyltransferase [Deltaproteobacteria bacterium HGW-Deltaproteobacteria-15]|jgi:N-acetylglucosaminyldiphosphoundecaprenol N-acetyl-beta-D-mannosaminyltransferase|nr:MAG: glycosyltransferase [Deltaproteobacteria bacterium HGW-Deltaproteobacteria-15]
MSQAVDTIFDWLDKCEKHYVCVTGVHGVMESQKDGKLLFIHNASGLTVPDGVPIVWGGRMLGYRGIGRVYGPDLMLRVCKLSVRKGYRHFLYGGNTGVSAELKRTLEDRFPGIQIAGIYTPPFRPLTEAEEKQLTHMVARASPDLFWVGLSTPKQEHFMAEHIHKLDTKIMLGVGAAFDIHTGHAKDAPLWIKTIGMQWFHRLCQNPRRLWRRYLINNPLFIYKFSRQLLTNKR